MTKEIDSIFFKTELLEEFSASFFVIFELVPSLWILNIDIAHLLVERTKSLLFKHTHEA